MLRFLTKQNKNNYTDIQELTNLLGIKKTRKFNRGLFKT